MKKRWNGLFAVMLVALPMLLQGCGGQTASQTSVVSEVSSADLTGNATGSSEGLPSAPEAEPFTAADGTFSVMLPEGFVEQNTDAASGTTTWIHPKKGITLVATSVQQGGLQPDSFTQEAMAQTLSATYEQAEIKVFEQKAKDEGSLFLYEADVTQNDQAYHLIQALYADTDQTVTLVMTLGAGSRAAEGRAMMDAMTESLHVL